MGKPAILPQTTIVIVHLLEYYKYEPIEPAVKPVMAYFGQ